MVPPELLLMIFATRPRWERGCVFYFVCLEWRRVLRSDASLWACIVVVPIKPTMAKLAHPNSRLPLPEASLLSVARRRPDSRRRCEHHIALLHAHQGALPLLLTELSTIPDTQWVEEISRARRLAHVHVHGEAPTSHTRALRTLVSSPAIASTPSVPAPDNQDPDIC